MENSIILCEGETDQALIGCYLEKTAGWEFKRLKKSLFPKEEICWYIDTNNCINGIWQVGGNDFNYAIQSIARREKSEHTFDKIVIITDHDDQTSVSDRLEQILDNITSTLNRAEIEQNFSDNKWGRISFEDDFSIKQTVQFLYLLVPLKETGALETFMMHALSEKSLEKKEVIDQAKKFVRDFRSSYYLKKRREKVKAELGVSMSVFSPDRIFTTMKELIDSVEWDEFAASHKQFDLLKDL